MTDEKKELLFILYGEEHELFKTIKAKLGKQSDSETLVKLLEYPVRLEALNSELARLKEKMTEQKLTYDGFVKTLEKRLDDSHTNFLEACRKLADTVQPPKDPILEAERFLLRKKHDIEAAQQPAPEKGH